MYLTISRDCSHSLTSALSLMNKTMQLILVVKAAGLVLNGNHSKCIGNSSELFGS